MNNKNMIGLGIIIILVIGYFTLNKQSPKLSTADTVPVPQISSTPVVEQKIRLAGVVKQLNNNSDPAQYSYELALDVPFYDELQSVGNPVSKVPILSRDKALQDSINKYVGKEVAMVGLMAWGVSESRYLEVSTISDLSMWKTYTNKTFDYIVKFPENYQALIQSEKQKSQVGVDNNIVIQKKSGSGANVIVIDVYQDKENISLDDYMNQNSKQLGITGPLHSDRFNGNESLANKNQPGINQFLKQGLYIYHITAATASQDKEISDIVATFRFTQ